MQITRRNLLRNSALLSLGHAFGLRSLLHAQGPAAFNMGVRVFFAGAWIFGRDPTHAERMYAVSFDPSEDRDGGPTMKHIFPFGLWKKSYDTSGDWDTDQPNLEATPKAHKVLQPHVLSVDGFQVPNTDVDALFGTADDKSGFTYMLNSNSSLSHKPRLEIKLDAALQRVIALPVPTCIIPAAYRTKSTVEGATRWRHVRASGEEPGVATTHIFVYDGAAALNLARGAGKPQQVAQASRDSSANFHFHTVPDPALKPDDSHAPMMFKHCVRQIKHPFFSRVSGMHLNAAPSETEPVTPGPLVPQNVSREELEIKTKDKSKDWLLNVHLASCGSGGMGVGGNAFAEIA